MKTILFILAFALSTLSFAAEPEKNAKLHALFDEEWQFRLKEDPLFATNVGVHTYNDKLPSVTQKDQERRAQASQQFLNRLHEIDPTTLNGTDRVSYELFERQLKDNISEVEFRAYLIPWTADSGFHTGFARLSKLVPLNTVKDYENYIARMNACPVYMGQYIELLREAVKTGMTLPSAVLEGYELSMSTHVVDDPTKSVFYAPFAKFPVTVTASEHERLRKQGTDAIRNGIVPGYKSLLDFFLRNISRMRAKLWVHLSFQMDGNFMNIWYASLRHSTYLLKKFIKQDYVKSIAFKKKCMKSSTRLDSKATLQLS